MTDFNSLNFNCGCSEERRNRHCINWVLFILSVLFAFTLGLIIGAVLAIFLVFALPSLIAIAVILAILIAITLVYRRCSRSSCDCDN